MRSPCRAIVRLCPRSDSGLSTCRALLSHFGTGEELASRAGAVAGSEEPPLARRFMYANSVYGGESRGL